MTNEIYTDKRKCTKKKRLILIFFITRNDVIINRTIDENVFMTIANRMLTMKFFLTGNIGFEIKI